MSTKDMAGAYDCYESAEQNEPMFVLLARDPQAPDTIRWWVEERQLYGTGFVEETDQEREALAVALQMEEWRKINRP